MLWRFQDGRSRGELLVRFYHRGTEGTEEGMFFIGREVPPNERIPPLSVERKYLVTI
jgi:hypothetical protein